MAITISFYCNSPSIIRLTPSHSSHLRRVPGMGSCYRILYYSVRRMRRNSVRRRLSHLEHSQQHWPNSLWAATRSGWLVRTQLAAVLRVFWKFSESETLVRRFGVTDRQRGRKREKGQETVRLHLEHFTTVPYSPSLIFLPSNACVLSDPCCSSVPLPLFVLLASSSLVLYIS